MQPIRLDAGWAVGGSKGGSAEHQVAGAGDLVPELQDVRGNSQAGVDAPIVQHHGGPDS